MKSASEIAEKIFYECLVLPKVITPADVIKSISEYVDAARKEAVEWKVKEILSEPGMMLHWKSGVDYGRQQGEEDGYKKALAEYKAEGLEIAFAEGRRQAFEEAAAILMRDSKESGDYPHVKAEEIRAKAKGDVSDSDTAREK